MLDSITISNFKAIQDKEIDQEQFIKLEDYEIDEREGKFYQKRPLILNELAKVNYLVGPNGCGKSSMLEYLNDCQHNRIAPGLTYKINKETVHKESFIKYIREQFQMRFDGQQEKKVFGDNFDEIIIDLIFKDEIIIKTDKFLSQPNPNSKDRLGFQRAGFNEYVCNTLKSIYNPRDQEFFQPWQIDGWQIAELVTNYATIDTYNPSQEMLNLTALNSYQSQTSRSKISNFERYLNYENLCEFFLEKDFIKEFSGGDYRIEEYQGENQETGLKETKFKIVSDYKIVLVENLATGYRNLFTYYYSTKNFLKNKNTGFSAGFANCLIEEPETGLHPKLQKIIPQIFEDLSKEYFVTFLISTHSPFIISAAGEIGDQNVYLIKEGEVMDKDEKKKSESGFDFEAEKGYHGRQIASVVVKMLGAEGKDLGYPENIILVEEGSKKELLEAFFQRPDINKNIQVIQSSFGGDADFPNFEKLVKELIGLNSFFRQNVVFSDKYIVFCDYVDEYYDESNLKWIEKVKKDKANTHNKAMNMKLSLGKRFIAKSSELEKMYPLRFIDEKYKDWDKTKTFGSYLKCKNEENVNKIKCEFAKYVGENITKEEFKEFFLELHNCIFGELEGKTISN